MKILSNEEYERLVRKASAGETAMMTARVWTDETKPYNQNMTEEHLKSFYHEMRATSNWYFNYIE